MMAVQVEESTGQEAKATGRSRGRSSRAVNPNLAGPSSPAASRDSGAGKRAKVASPYAASPQHYLDTGSSYSQVPAYMVPQVSIQDCKNLPSVLPACVHNICVIYHAKILCVANQLCTSLILPAVKQ